MFNGYAFTLFWVLLFIITVFFAYIYIIYPPVKDKTTATTTKWKNKLECEKIKKEAVLNSWTIYLWAYPKRVIIINTAFILAFFFSVFLYAITGVWFYIIIFVFYLVALKYQYKWYKEFPVIAEEKLKEHEAAIEDALLKGIKSAGDQVEEILSQSDAIKDTPLEYLAPLKLDVIKHPTGVSKFDFPPFVELPAPKKKVIKTRQMQYLILTRDFIYVALSPTPFDLLNPKRGDEKKKCALVRAPGPTRDYYYSMIRRVYYDKDEGGIKIVFFNEDYEKPILIKVAKEPDAKPTIFKIKERLRLLERQRLSKVDEIYKFYAIKDALKVSVEELKKEQQEEQKKDTQEEEKKEENKDEKKE